MEPNSIYMDIAEIVGKELHDTEGTSAHEGVIKLAWRLERYFYAHKDDFNLKDWIEKTQ